MNQQDIEQVVKAVLLKMKDSSQPASTVHEMGVFASLDDAVAAAKRAQQGLKSVAMRQLAIHAIREAGEKHARELAELAVSETGMGRVDDKFAKNVAQARGTPGVECLSPQVLTGDNGLTLIENAPWGVVASVTPSTNPAATVINNAISLIAAGNSVVFAPHPAAKKVSQRAITLLNQAVVAAGGPENLLVTVANPDIETAQRLFKYPGIGLLVVTGGEAVVDAARKHTNKRLIAAGAGNPPVVVDETADLPRAAQSIVKGASFDNNIICADEKVLIVVDSVADELMRLMEGQHAVKLTAAQGRVVYAHQPGQMIIDEVFGSGTDARALAAAQLGQVARRMADLIVEVITGALSPLAQSLMQTGLLPADITPEVITLSGGVGECYRHQPADPFCFSDIGPLLATALHEHPRLREMNVQFPAQTVRATVIGAGAHTLSLSGSTIWLEDVQLPLRNLPVAIPQDDADLVNAWRQALLQLDLDPQTDAYVLALPATLPVRYAALLTVINALTAFVARYPNPHPLLVVAEQDFGKALGMLLRPQLPQLPLAVIDEVVVRAGDYIDIGTPLFGGSVVPVTVKSLAFPS
ncbi:TPA: aldehyde dehydrogenase [Salmonella enterica subsp. enterica serovar Victoria]|nr:aldehyde dehydrogenase [Salmonella enterica subsp. enterica]HCZ2451006.1 aldehyde dehydrogenase [Salmonella enterica subsp. enterica]